MRRSGTAPAAFSASSRSRLRLRWTPRLFSASAWISSMMTQRTFASTGVHLGWLSITAKLSGVVSNRCGGAANCRARSFGPVSPERRPTRIGGASP